MKLGRCLHQKQHIGPYQSLVLIFVHGKKYYLYLVQTAASLICHQIGDNIFYVFGIWGYQRALSSIQQPWDKKETIFHCYMEICHIVGTSMHKMQCFVAKEHDLLP